MLIALLSMGKALIRKETKWEYQVSVKPVFGENLHRRSYLMLRLWHVEDPGVSRIDLYMDRSSHHRRHQRDVQVLQSTFLFAAKPCCHVVGVGHQS